jgi:hypothetical protein
VVRDGSDFRNLPMLVSFIQEKSPSTKIHLVLWQISLRRIAELKQHFFFTNLMFSQDPRTPKKQTDSEQLHPPAQATFETVTLQGTMEKEDLTELCSILLAKTTAISFLSCQVDFKRINITESLDMIRSIQIRGDSEVLKIGSLLDNCPNLKRLEYCGINIFDQISKYNFTDTLRML